MRSYYFCRHTRTLKREQYTASRKRVNKSRRIAYGDQSFGGSEFGPAVAFDGNREPIVTGARIVQSACGTLVGKNHSPHDLGGITAKSLCSISCDYKTQIVEVILNSITSTIASPISVDLASTYSDSRARDV